MNKVFMPVTLNFSLNQFCVLFLKIVSHLVFGMFLLLIGGICVIGAYHTTTYFISNALTFYMYFVLPITTLYFAYRVPLLLNPIYSLLYLILVFFQIVLFYLFIGAEFLAFVFLIVYVGAIAILFLFVIMLLNVKELSSIIKEDSIRPHSFFFIILLTVFTNFFIFLTFELETFCLLSNSNYLANELYSSDSLVFFINYQFHDIQLFSHLLYDYYNYLFFVVSVLLLTAMLGAIVLAASTFDEIKV